MPSLSHVVADFDPALVFHPPGAWSQGRTVYGGLTAALSLQAALGAVRGTAPPLKAAQILFAGPAGGALTFQPTVLREGKSSRSVAVDCVGDSGVAVRSTFLFAQARPSRLQRAPCAAPVVAPPHACPTFDDEGKGPALLQNFEIRFAGAARPLSGSPEPELVAWVRHRGADHVDPAVALVAMADCLPPADLVCLTEFVPVSSMTWSFELPQPAAAGEWFLLRSRSVHSVSGYTLQAMEVWDQQGRLAMSGQQTVALFG
ncbi:thioesterase family protein [Acidovorax sp. NCPPB 2350]|nr:thioesterase family protein [Acidovorax sp. NCPPB 2350]